MALNTEKIDAAALALLYLTLHDTTRAWKSMDWDALARLHDKGFIHDPVNQAKSVVFTDAGLNEAKRLCAQQIETPAPSPDPRRESTSWRAWFGQWCERHALSQRR